MKSKTTTQQNSLSAGLAGEILQKFIDCGIWPAICGGRHTGKPLRI